MDPLRPLRAIVDAFLEEDSPRQLAAGFVMGLLVGLVPKGNLTAQALTVAACATQTNLAVFAVSAAVFSLLSPLADPLTHPIGLWLLQAGPLQGLWTALYNLPVVPWTHFYNTVVLGSLTLGLALAWPAYRAAVFFFRRHHPAIAGHLKRYRVVRALSSAGSGGR